MDNRFNLKVKFQIYGQTFEHECSLNWFSPNGGCDRRITEIFEEWHDKAYGKWTEKLERERQRRDSALNEARDFEEYKRLKQKFEKGPQQ